MAATSAVLVARSGGLAAVLSGGRDPGHLSFGLFLGFCLLRHVIFWYAPVRVHQCMMLMRPLCVCARARMCMYVCVPACAASLSFYHLAEYASVVRYNPSMANIDSSNMELSNMNLRRLSWASAFLAATL